jgi:hypothetical protein
MPFFSQNLEFLPMHHTIIKIATFASGMLLGVAVFFAVSGGVPMLFAQSQGGGGGGISQQPSEPTAPDSSCITGLGPIFEKEKTKFINFMNQHFKNAAPNSTLMKTGIAELNNYKRALLDAEKRFSLKSERQADAISETSRCDSAVRQQFAIADSVFQSFVYETSYAKKSTALTEKLHSINGKLATLLSLIEQFDSYFVSFNNRLPGYVSTSCIKK